MRHLTSSIERYSLLYTSICVNIREYYASHNIRKYALCRCASLLVVQPTLLQTFSHIAVVDMCLYTVIKCIIICGELVNIHVWTRVWLYVGGPWQCKT